MSSTTQRPEDVVVVGAGPAGLATSACLRREGVAHVVLEREPEANAVWRGHYDRLHLHTTKTLSALPMTPWPRDVPRYPSRDDVVRYLQHYAATHDIAPRFGVDVRSITQRGERWVVQTDRDMLTPRAVVVATGRNRVPRWPSLVGLERFEGLVLHAHDYRNPKPFLDKRALVVGCGNSGAEIALDLAEHDVDVAMVVRGPVHIVPRDLFGRPIQQTNIWLQRLPLTLRDAIASAAVHLAIGDLSRWGLERPAVGPNRMIETTGRIPVLDMGTVSMIKRGKITVLPAVEGVFARNIRFASGTVHPFDAIVLATGYDTGLDRLVEGFDALTDAFERPRQDASAADSGLYFIGFQTPSTGALREIAREAPRVASSVRAALVSAERQAVKSVGRAV